MKTISKKDFDTMMAQLNNMRLIATVLTDDEPVSIGDVEAHKNWLKFKDAIQEALDVFNA